MIYRKINLELIAFGDEADDVIAALHQAVDRIEESHTIFGGTIEAVPVEHTGTRRKSALRHTVAAGETAVAALRSAGDKVANACRKVL